MIFRRLKIAQKIAEAALASRDDLECSAYAWQVRRIQFTNSTCILHDVFLRGVLAGAVLGTTQLKRKALADSRGPARH